MGRDFSVPEILDGVAAVSGGDTCLVFRETRYSFSQFAERTRRLAEVLKSFDMPAPIERSDLEDWQSGQSHVALMLRNGPEYLECMVGCFRARAASFNVNWRYTEAELLSLFRDARPAVVVVGDEFAGTVAAVTDQLDWPVQMVQVADETGLDLVPGAVRYEMALEDALLTLTPDDVSRWSADDLYILFTGGTTGSPKGVLWRQADAIVAAFGFIARSGDEFASLDELADALRHRSKRRVVMPTPPFVHGAAQWSALGAILSGGQVVIQDDPVHSSPSSILDTVEREGVTELLLVGDAFGVPIADALEYSPRPLSTLRLIINGGAALSARTRERLLEAVPHVRIVDNMGSSESGRQASRSFTSSLGQEIDMEPLPDTVVLSADRSRVLDASDDGELGWLARSGRIPLGYLNDPGKTRETFVPVGDKRFTVPGDRARLRPDGRVDVVGRDSTTINTGGEKVFAEEVESAILSHPDVSDVIVFGRTNDRWGSEVVALVSVSTEVSSDQILAVAATTLARYKLPKQIVFVERVPRTVAGKSDRREAQVLFEAGSIDTTA